MNRLRRITLSEEKLDRLVEFLDMHGKGSSDMQQILSDIYQQMTYNPSDVPFPPIVPITYVKDPEKPTRLKVVRTEL